MTDVEALRQAVESESRKLAGERQKVAALTKEAARAEAEIRELKDLLAAMANVVEADRLAVVVRALRRQFRPTSESGKKSEKG